MPQLPDIPDPAEATDPWIGRLVGERYLVTARLARGSMGSVYEAVQTPLGRQVALKVLDIRPDHRERPGADKKDRKRFLREASLLSRLTHPNTVRVFDYGLQDDTPYIVMELVPGDTLAQILKKTGRLQPLRAVHIAQQICGALGEAHDFGVVHRDLKPANVLVSHGPGATDIKVVDFGLVKEMRDAVEMTADGALIGTPMYMSPEQIRGEAIDQRCDIYALGVTLYLMTTGRVPFQEKQTAALLLAHIQDPPPPFATVPGAPTVPQLEQVVLRCLAKRPEDRFADADEVFRALCLCEAVMTGQVQSNTALVVRHGRVELPMHINVPTNAGVIDSRTLQRTRRRRMLARAGAVMVVLTGTLLALVIGYLGVYIVLATRPSPQPAPPQAPVVAPATSSPSPSASPR